VALPLRTHHQRHTTHTHAHARQHHCSRTRTHRRARPRPIFPSAAGPPRDIIIIRRTRAQRYTARPIVKYVPAGYTTPRARADRAVSCCIVPAPRPPCRFDPYYTQSS